MAKRTAPVLPGTERLLAAFGERLQLARRRRQLTAKQVAERAGMTVNTLRSLERGHGGVTLGAYASVMQVLGLEQDIAQWVAEDTAGRALQDAKLVMPPRSGVSGRNRTTDTLAVEYEMPAGATRTPSDAGVLSPGASPRRLANKSPTPALKSAPRVSSLSSETLAALLEGPAPRPKKRVR